MMKPVLAISLRLGDSALVLGQQIGTWVSRSPTIELDIAFGNFALDLIGQANLFYELAGEIEGKGRSADDLAYWRDAHEFLNFQLVEQPNGDFAQTMLRQLFYATYVSSVFDQMKNSNHSGLAAIAEKAEKEMLYHVRHCGEWVVRLGDGTDESHQRLQAGLDFLWPWTHELFAYDQTDKKLVEDQVLPDSKRLKAEWLSSVSEVFAGAGLEINDDGWKPEGGRIGQHTEHLSYILQEMQTLPRTHPGANW